jgi:transcriptional regulator with XRE-family HTH domain
MPSVRLIEALERRRAALDMSHTAFARHLGMSHPYWSLVRRGLRQPTHGFIGRVLTAHPDLYLFISETSNTHQPGSRAA